jgi:hypothetical protein
VHTESAETNKVIERKKGSREIKKAWAYTLDSGLSPEWDSLY